MRELENARVHLVESLRLNNQSFDTRLQLTKLCMAMELEEEAYEHIKNALRIDPSDEEAKSLYI